MAQLTETDKAKIIGVLETLNIPSDGANWEAIDLPTGDNLTFVDWVKKEHSDQVSFQLDVISPYVQETSQVRFIEVSTHLSDQVQHSCDG